MHGEEEVSNMNTIKDYVKIMDQYNKGEKELAKAWMCKRLDPTVKKIIYHYKIPVQMREDAYQEGMVGIIENIDKYNPEISSPETFFSVRILHNIDRYFQKSVNKSSVHYAKKIKKANDAEKEILSSGEKPTEEKIAKVSGMKLSDIKMTLAHKIRVQQHVYKLEEEPEIPSNSESLDEIVIRKEKAQKVRYSLKKIGPRGRDILSMKYGIDKDRPYTVKEIAKKYKTTENQINQEIGKNLIFVKYIYKMDKH